MSICPVCHEVETYFGVHTCPPRWEVFVHEPPAQESDEGGCVYAADLEEAARKYCAGYFDEWYLLAGDEIEVYVRPEWIEDEDRQPLVKVLVECEPMPYWSSRLAETELA